LAEAAGIKGVRIEDPADLDAGVAAAFAHPGPVVIDAVVERMELAMPPKVTTEMAKGFTLYTSTCSRWSSMVAETRWSNSPRPICCDDNGAFRDRLEM
jgi:hypothetical protein